MGNDKKLKIIDNHLHNIQKYAICSSPAHITNLTANFQVSMPGKKELMTCL